MTVLYEKRGRRYVPVSDYEQYDRDTMRLGEFRLTYCYAEGGRRYTYNVTPDTVSFVAAAEIAAEAMEHTIIKASPATPRTAMYTKKELALLDEFRRRASAIDMLWPSWWEYATPREIAYAGIDAVRNYKP